MIERHPITCFTNQDLFQEVDIGLGPLTMSESRAEAVDFADRLTNLQLRVLAGKRNPEQDPWGFLNPLGPLVWLGLFAALMGVSAASVALSEGSQKLKLSWYKRAFVLFHTHLGILLRQGKAPDRVRTYS